MLKHISVEKKKTSWSHKGAADTELFTACNHSDYHSVIRARADMWLFRVDDTCKHKTEPVVAIDKTNNDLNIIILNNVKITEFSSNFRGDIIKNNNVWRTRDENDTQATDSEVTDAVILGLGRYHILSED